MKKNTGFPFGMIFVVIFVLASPLGLSSRSTSQEGRTQRHVVLLGASVGRAWDIPALPRRMGIQDFSFEYVPGGGFDKTEALEKLLAREENKPDAIFIKECAAYFPGDFLRYQGLFKGWVELCKRNRVIPIPATIVPVTRLHSFKKVLIDLIKERGFLNEGNPLENNRNRSILEFNDWVRVFAEKEGLTVLDLESAVRYSEINRFLREDFAKVDGLHLNSKAYESLDKIVLPALQRINWSTKDKN